MPARRATEEQLDWDVILFWLLVMIGTEEFYRWLWSLLA
jgi:hypothetical protein